MSTATDVSRARSEDGASRKLRVLFFLEGSEHLANFQTLLLALLDRGHQVHLALDYERRGRVPDAARTLEDLGARHGSFRHVALPRRQGVWGIPANSVRRGVDYLRYLEPEYADDDALRDGARRCAPRLLLAVLARPPFRWSWARDALDWVLRRLDGAMPVPRWIKSFVSEQSPDVMLVSPLVDFGSVQGDYVRRAEAQGIPSVLVVAGRDDLRAKGAIRDVPTLTIVPTRSQADEAVQLQGLPADRVVAVPDDAHVSSAQGVVGAIEGTAPRSVPRSRRGMVLRPILLLLTPLLWLLLLLLRPRATVRAVRNWSHDRRRIRRQRHREAEMQTKLQAKEKAKAEKLEEKERARRVKLQKAEARAAKEHARENEREGHAKANPKARRAHEKKADAGKADVEKSEASKTGQPKTKTQAAPEQGGHGRRKTLRGRMGKRMRARARAVRRGLKQARRSARRTYNRRYRFTYKTTITRVPARDELPALLNARGLVGKGVEIGVKTGKYSDELLRNWRGAELISIDPWLSVDREEYVDRSNVSQDEFERYYEITRDRLSPYGDRSTIWRTTSMEAARQVSDHSLDFAYIDARHDYQSVKEDLAAWCAKVRPGGILAGHDYVDGDFPEGEFYVKSAVDEFFNERGIAVHATEGPSVVESFPTWIVEVPAEGIEPPRDAPR